MARQQDVEPLEALAGTLAAMAEAARCTGGGVRTAGRRAARAGAGVGRRAWEGGLDRGRRANVAVRVYRGHEQTYRRRPSEYVMTGLVMGFAGAFAVVALGRAIMRQPSGGTDAPDGTVPDERRIRSLAGRIARFRSGPAPVTVPDPATTGPATAEAKTAAAKKDGATEVPMPTPGAV